MTERATVGESTRAERIGVLHVVVQAGPTNSQWNEHCLPAADQLAITVCSLLPATVPDDPRITRVEGDGTVRGALSVLRRVLRAGGYDVVHVHAPASAAMLLAACALERRRWHDVLFTLHNSWPNLRPRNKPLAALELLAFPWVVACSQSVESSVPKAVRLLRRWSIQVVANGVDVDRVDRALATDPAQDAERTERTGFTVVAVGRLIRIKDQAVLLEAFAGVAGPDDRLLVVGEGPLRDDLERLADRLGVSDRVRLLGLLPRDEVYRVLGGADLFVSPSRGEGLPLSVLEAMAARLPVVLSDIAPHREIADTTPAAHLVPVGDVQGTAEAIARLRALTVSERAALGGQARAAVTHHFSVEAMTSGYRRVYSAMSGRASLVRR